MLTGVVFQQDGLGLTVTGQIDLAGAKDAVHLWGGGRGVCLAVAGAARDRWVGSRGCRRSRSVFAESWGAGADGGLTDWQRLDGTQALHVEEHAQRQPLARFSFELVGDEVAQAVGAEGWTALFARLEEKLRPLDGMRVVADHQVGAGICQDTGDIFLGWILRPWYS